MSKMSVEEVRKIEIFKNIKRATAEKLTKIAIKKSFKKGEHLFRDKEAIESIYIILSGKYTLYKHGENNQKRVIFILSKWSLLNDIFFTDFFSSINCEVFESGEVMLINKLTFTKLMEEDFQLTKEVINSLSMKVRRSYRQIKNTIPIKIEKKLAAKLWKLARDYGIGDDDGVLINMKISITYLADMFGSKRETISRAMKILEKEGLVIQKNRSIIIKNLKELSNYYKSL